MSNWVLILTLENAQPTPTNPNRPTPTGPKRPTPTGPKRPTPTGPKHPTPTVPQRPTPNSPQPSTPTSPQPPTPTGPQAQAFPQPPTPACSQDQPQPMEAWWRRTLTGLENSMKGKNSDEAFTQCFQLILILFKAHPLVKPWSELRLDGQLFKTQYNRLALVSVVLTDTFVSYWAHSLVVSWRQGSDAYTGVEGLQ